MDRREPLPELSRVLELEKIFQDDIDLAIDATEEECRRIAGRLDLVGVERLSAQLSIVSVPDGPVIHVNGRFSAKVVQRCVVSLERLETEIEEPLSVQFGHLSDVESDLDFGQLPVGEQVAMRAGTRAACRKQRRDDRTGEETRVFHGLVSGRLK